MSHIAATGYDAESSRAGGPDVHLLHYFRVLHKRRRTAATGFALVVLPVCFYTLTAKPIYQARVQILIEKESENLVSFKEAYAQNQSTEDYYQTQYKMLQSRALARRTIEALHLWDEPAIQPSVGETQRQSKAIDAFLAALTIAPVRSSRLVDVKFESPVASQSSQVANTLARMYIEQNMEMKFLSSKEASDWLGEQLAGQRKLVDASEQAVQRYREQNGAIALDDRQNIVVQRLADLNAAVTRAKTERIAKEALYHQLQASQADPARLDTFPAILSNAFIAQQKSEVANLQRQYAQLSQKLGDKHPDITRLQSAIDASQARIAGEVTKIVQSVRSEFESALAQENSLVAALNQQKGEALAMNRQGIEYGVLERDAASNRQIFDSVMQRAKEMDISGELKTSNIRVVDAAETPRKPIRPDRRNNLVLGVLGGAMLALGLTFFAEYADNRIKNPDDLQQYLDLPFLGMIPAIFDKTVENPLVGTRAPNHFSESIRALRTHLLFSSAAEGGRSVVVTSTGPGEGKTLAATNLAAALAQAGHRVLIVDADMRKPRVHTVFGRAGQPGLSNVLAGNTTASAAVHKTAIPGLWLLPAGVHPPNPAELLGSRRCADFLASLTRNFEWIIVDTPPVMAVSDAVIMARLVTGVVFVVGCEMTSRHAARRACDQVEQGRGKFFGTVLNRVDLQHHSYYYSQYYRREYSDYYHNPTRS